MKNGMTVAEIMSRVVPRIVAGSSIRQAAEMLAASQASDLVVVDENGQFLGVLSEGDLIRAALPRFDEIMTESDSLLQGHVLFAEKSRELAERPVECFMISQPITLAPEKNVLNAAGLMALRQIRRFPVLEGRRLVGTVSRADVCRGVLS